MGEKSKKHQGGDGGEKRAENTKNLFWRKRVHFVEDANCFQHGCSYDFQAFRAELVDGVLRCVPEDVVVAVVEVDEVGAGHAALNEGNVIVIYGQGTCEEMRLVTKT